MPEISRFFGIIIKMFAEGRERHHRPHFHAYVQDDSAIVALAPIEILSSSLSRRHERFVQVWAEIHEDEQLKDWELLKIGEEVQPIEPLR